MKQKYMNGKYQVINNGIKIRTFNSLEEACGWILDNNVWLVDTVHISNGVTNIYTEYMYD